MSPLVSCDAGNASATCSVCLDRRLLARVGWSGRIAISRGLGATTWPPRGLVRFLSSRAAGLRGRFRLSRTSRIFVRPLDAGFSEAKWTVGRDVHVILGTLLA